MLPVRALKLTFGTSFQDLDFDVPTPHSAHAFAFTGDIQVRETLQVGDWRHRIGADYSLRKATSTLDSDFVYTRHVVSGDYTASTHHHLFGVHVRGGEISGEAPLFERFSLGNSFELRGWDKFDVAPAGGSRLAYGSLEYRYRPFQIFYDLGAVWDPGQPATTRHSVGVGLVSKGGAFFSLAFPVRTHDVTPVVLFGFKY